MNRPPQNPRIPDRLPAPVRRLHVLAAIAGYLALVTVAWLTASDALSAICVVLLVSAVLLPRLRARSLAAWLIWLAAIAAVLLLTLAGHGRIALDLVPLAINLGLAMFFGVSLLGTHTPLIARAIIAMEGRERLQLPRVATYARTLTLVWTLLFTLQAALFAWLMFVSLPHSTIDSRSHAWALTYLRVGGLLLPALFMLVEYLFRRWYLRHLPHESPRQFIQALILNWPQLLRDGDVPVERKH